MIFDITLTVLAVGFGVWAVLLIVLYIIYYPRIWQIHVYLGEPNPRKFSDFFERRVAVPVLVAAAFFSALSIFALFMPEAGVFLILASSFALVSLVVATAYMGGDIGRLRRYNRYHGPQLFLYSLTEPEKPTRRK